MRPNQIKLEDKLRSMKGLKWMYNTMVVEIQNWKYEAEYITIVTTGPWPVKKIDEALAFINENFQEVEQDTENSNVAVVEENLPKVPEMKLVHRLDDLGDFLFEQLKKIQDNPSYAQQQSPQINITAKNIIEVAKTEIQHFNSVNEAIRNR